VGRDDDGALVVVDFGRINTLNAGQEL
jgi:hypothetical protein